MYQWRVDLQFDSAQTILGISLIFHVGLFYILEIPLTFLIACRNYKPNIQLSSIVENKSTPEHFNGR